MNDLTLITADDSGSDQNIHRIEHSSVVAPGRYWRCVRDVEGIWVRSESKKFQFHAGLIYLLTRLEFFEGKLHSVVFLDDPTQSTESATLTMDLLLGAFEQVSDETAKAFRNEQMAEVQQLAADVQKEMADAQMDPTILQPVIEAGLQKWERELARNRPDDEESGKANLPTVTTNGQFNLAGAVTHKIRSTDVAVFRHMAQREGKIAEIRATWIKEKVEEMSKVLKQLTPFFTEPAAVGMARAQDSLDLAKDAEMGLRSLHLYTGVGVEVETLMTGKSAPANEPLTLYQRKLYMNEEFAVWADIDNKFDYYEGSGKFFKALVANEGLREQLIPAKRGVLAMATRIDAVKYDAKDLSGLLEAEGKNQINKALFLLVRDGDNWYQVWSAEPTHELSARLFPTRNEMEKVFAGVDGETIDFQDLRFTNRATEFDRKSLVYKRFLILACGLDHRLNLFGRFYPEEEALSFISMPFQKKYMRFIADDDSDAMLGDTVGDVHSFIRHNKNQLAAGARVLVFGEEVLQQEAAPGAFSKGTYNEKTYKKEYFRTAAPVSQCNLLTVHRDKEDLVVYLPVRKHPSYDRFGRARPVANEYFDVKVSLNKIDRLGQGLGYLLSDIIRAEDLRPFIYNRRSRGHHVDYIYGFKRAIPVLEAEERMRAPAMQQLHERAQSHYGLSSAGAMNAVYSAIQTYREKTSGAAALPLLDSPEFAKLDFELAEAAFAFTHALPKVREFVEGLGGRIVCVKRAKKGQLVAYYEQPDSERDLRITNWRWLGRRTFTPGGRLTKEPMQTVSFRGGMVVGEFELFGTDSANLDKHGIGADLQKIQTVLDFTAKMGEVLAGAFKGERQGVSDQAWLTFATPPAGYARKKKNKAWLAANQTVIIPVSVKTDTGLILGVDAELSELLYFYGSDAQRAVMLEQGYKVPAPVKDQDRKVVPYTGPKVRLFVDSYAHLEHYEPMFHYDASTWHTEYLVRDYDYMGENKLNHDLGKIMEKGFHKKSSSFSSRNTLEPESLWFPEQVRAATGEFKLSQMFPGLPTA